jgi:predicted transcriptional regulator of viral defense system
MLEKPTLCGRMVHILEVWDAYAEIYMDEIIKAVDNNPKKIIKVRAGYILDEIIGYKSDRVYKWLENAQRGSSQVLDPDAPFSPTFSEKWMLSINV